MSNQPVKSTSVVQNQPSHHPVGDDVNNNNATDGSSTTIGWKKRVLVGAGVATTAVLVGGATPLVVIGAVKLAGFGAGGIAAGSAAASVMGATATGWGWLLPAVSACQSIGATASLGVAGTSAWAGGGAASYFGIRKLVSKKDDKKETPSE